MVPTEEMYPMPSKSAPEDWAVGYYHTTVVAHKACHHSLGWNIL